MGGDFGPRLVVCASVKSLQEHPKLHLVLVGDSAVIESVLTQCSQVDYARLTIHHASESIAMSDLPAHALRHKSDSSMRVALQLLRDKQVQACVSAGNTGALMAISRFVLKTLPGIDRPAIASVLPNLRGHSYVLDLGANVDCSAEHLLQFGVMGAMLVAAIEHRERPSVGLLNIGEEAIKGNDVVKEAGELLRASGLNSSSMTAPSSKPLVCAAALTPAAVSSLGGVLSMVAQLWWFPTTPPLPRGLSVR